MKLTQEQKTQIKAWIEAGESLSDVQKRIKEDFGLSMTYLDVRLLVMETGAEIKQKEEPKKETPPAPDNAAVPQEDAPPPGPFADAAGDTEAASVSVSVDTVVVPGAMVSGSVIFSDGSKARWFFDSYGRFGLEPDVVGYKPSSADMKAFQQILSRELQARGY